VFRSALSEGRRAGLVLGAFVVVVGVLGLGPTVSWLPEAPLVTVAIAVPVIGLALTGFRGFRRAGHLSAGILAGTLAGAITGVVAGLALLALDQVFIDTVSKQPDKVINFPTSGYSTMRDYLLAHDLPTVAVGLVLGAVGGALLGLAGAGLGRILPATRSRARRPGGAPAPRP
jgi:hypothetical protein